MARLLFKYFQKKILGNKFYTKGLANKGKEKARNEVCT